MKITAGCLMALCLLILQVTGVLAAALEPNIDAGLNRDDPKNRAALEAECGVLGVMEVPEGMDPKDVRHCADHPEGRNRYGPNQPPALPDNEVSDKREVEVEVDDRVDPPNTSESASPINLFGRDTMACNSDTSPYNCSHGGYCWRECGWRYGPWCWLAGGNGSGPWMRCGKMRDCAYEKGGNCCTGAPSCGCDCRDKV